MLGWGRKTHVHLDYDITLDNSATVHIKSMSNVTYLFAVTTQKGASW